MPEEVVWDFQIRARRKSLQRLTHEDDDPEPTGWEKQVYPVFYLVDLDIVAGRDDAGLI
jgi:hypothetical protein